MHTQSSTTDTPTPRTTWAIVRSMRPHQWLKNLLCFVPVIFTGNLRDPSHLLGSTVAAISFCLAASAVYLFNDLRDYELDQSHPVKQKRPIASGMVSRRDAVIMIVLLVAGALASAGFCNFAFLGIVAFYLLQNVAYTAGLKRVVILDVMLVANGFLLRAAGGAFAIDVLASPWLVLCTLTLALTVAFGKRRHELTLLGDAEVRRHTLSEYSEDFLDQAMSIAAAAALVTYSLFTMSRYVEDTYGSQALVLSVPMVIYGVFRFVFLVKRERLAGEPTRMFVMDRPMLINGVLWIVVSCFAIYGPHNWLPWWRVGEG